MTVNNEKLVELLSDRTGLEAGEVESQLNELLQQLKQAVDSREPFVIEGFGSFETDDEGQLQFIPSSTLETEVNHRYAGMKPIELIGAFKETPEMEEGDHEQAQDEETVSDIEEFVAHSDTALPEENEAEAEKPEPEDEEEPVSQTEESGNGPSFVFDLESDLESEEELRGDWTDTIGRPVEEPAPEKAVAESVAPKKKSVPPRKKSRPKESQEDPIGRFLVAAVVVIALGVSGWLVYDMGFFDFSSDVSGQNMKTASATSAGRAQVVNKSAATPATSKDTGQKKEDREQKELKPIQKDELRSIADESRRSIYGLRGGAVPEAKSGYTIVVHSLQNESKARSLVQQLESDGYITLLSRAVVRGNTYWRVGLGQFKTVGDARNAVAKLPKTYRDSHFIKRIQ